jgi:hypothetical protein
MRTSALLRRRRLLLAIPLAAALGACSTWKPAPMPAPSRDEAMSGPVRVTRTEGSRVVLDFVKVDRDSLVGNAHAEPHGRVAIPAAEVRRMERRRVSAAATGALVLLSLAAAVAVVAAFFSHTDALIPPNN